MAGPPAGRRDRGRAAAGLRGWSSSLLRSNGEVATPDQVQGSRRGPSTIQSPLNGPPPHRFAAGRRYFPFHCCSAALATRARLAGPGVKAWMGMSPARLQVAPLPGRYCLSARAQRSCVEESAKPADDRRRRVDRRHVGFTPRDALLLTASPIGRGGYPGARSWLSWLLNARARARRIFTNVPSNHACAPCG